MTKLWKTTDANCKLVDYSVGQEYSLVSAPNTPVMFWPDDKVCLPVTMWLIEKAQFYYSKAGKKGIRGNSSGTVITRASLITHFVKYVFNKNNKNFASLNDDHIGDWKKSLENEEDPKNPLIKRRKNTQIGRIMRTGLSFLIWYQKVMLPHNNLIGEEIGNQITIEFKGTNKRGKSNKEAAVNHRHIPNNNTPSKVFAIGHERITTLYDVLRDTEANVEVRKRNECILKLLEASGGRRVEVSELTLEDINLALSMGILRLQSAKSDEIEPREVPIAKEWIEPVSFYVNTYRKKKVKELIKKGKLKNNPNYLFINLSTGAKLSETYITKMMSKLKLAANISEKTCAHMFRHRFITIQVATRIKDFKKGNLPIDVIDTILTKVSSLSGHQDPASLKPYIDIAFAELDAWETADKVLGMRSKLEATYRELQSIKLSLQNSKMTKEELLIKVDGLLERILSAKN
ncbi:tyrosine-type recombinase/integrase [Pseudoalteromonas piscicida]|uniref:tyrosine-type recombinase/integrase n=1 Tax=Pseudoalteromonas piscicida TaxID=43662 RepID=UPI0032BFDB84